MIITAEMLRKDLPPVIETEGYCNVVLALVVPEYSTKTNTYLPSWQTCNTAWYNKNHHLYQGWIGLDEQLPPENVR